MPRGANKGVLKGRILAMQRFIKYTKVFVTNNYVYIMANCCAEQRKTQEYGIKMVIRKNPNINIHQANCLCPAGSGWSAACKHIAALCFSLEYFSVTGM